MQTTETNYNKLKNDYDKYIYLSKDIGAFFGGPSLYFHNRALDERKINFLGDNHLEMIYATLTAWGMHRMGDTKTKMVSFEKFKTAILKQQEILLELKELKIEEVNNSDLPGLVSKLNTLCFNLEASASNSKLVGNSKTLAHILPNLIPPIDRQYAIRFFTTEPTDFFDGKEKFKQIQNFKKNEEEKYFEHIINKTYDFINHVKLNDEIKIEQPFNTSLPKIFDNLIVTYIRNSMQKAE